MAFKKKALTPEQLQAAQDRKARIGGLIKSISAMSQEQREAMIARVGRLVTCEARTLSVFNTCLLLSQLPTATMVGGFQQWRAQGRTVTKGSKALAMWVPTMKATQETPDSSEVQEMRFRLVNVFDISQTQEMTADAEIEEMAE